LRERTALAWSLVVTAWISGALPAAAGPAVRLVLTAPASVQSGVALTLNVAAVDATGAAVPGYTGAVRFTSTDGAGLLPADYVYTGAGTGADNGVHSFAPVVLATAGPQTLTVTDGAGLSGTAAVAVAPAVDPVHSGIEHVIVVMMENRSFDHFLGWLPGADGLFHQRFLDASGRVQRTHSLAPDFQGCGFLDPGHSYSDGRVQYNGGACNGWLFPGSNSDNGGPNGANDLFAIGFYRQVDLPFLGAAAPAWTTSDRYFAGILAETFPNRFHQHSAQTDRLHNTTSPSALPTIWDRLATAGLSGTYYFSDLAFLALWGPKYAAISKPFSQFLTDAAAGTLPNVAFIDPAFSGEATGTTNDDHPYNDVRNGEVFLNRIYDAVRQSPAWAHTVLVINYDEWGGFFDHVPPPTVPIPPATKAAGDFEGRLGFRVPLLVISPWSRRGYVSHETFDHTSVLKMIEWRWSLPPLTVRDQTANNLADLLDLSHPNLAAPAFNVPAGPFGAACPKTSAPATSGSDERSKALAALRELTRANGFPAE
jgi:phospholipase C